MSVRLSVGCINREVCVDMSSQYILIITSIMFIMSYQLLNLCRAISVHYMLIIICVVQWTVLSAMPFWFLL